ncbi:hypothetical protein [Kutzneria buriramensis]|uniref:Uncharacterized protein n=1 Tax=Kutzneria buriramensis TaxID=1045776 RepID=A0A3E0H6Z5_9PSEU|nr:hypothetical protein BCF44_11384 [Kutzneria buriramensis]
MTTLGVQATAAVCGAAPAFGAAIPITKVDFTPQDRTNALAHWTPERMKQLGVDPRPETRLADRQRGYPDSHPRLGSR